MAYEIQLQEMPDCCGILVPYRLFKRSDYRLPEYYIEDGSTSNRKTAEGYAKNWNEENKAENQEEYIARVKKQLSEWQKVYMGRKSYFLLTLNQKEDDVIGETVRELGFEVLVPMMKNPSGSRIVLYIFHLLEEKKREHVSLFKNAEVVEATPPVTEPLTSSEVEVTVRVTR